MKYFKRLKNKLLEKNLQENNRNRAALRYLNELGFSLPAIRKGLLDLNEIKLKNMIGNNTSFGTLSRTNKGTLDNEMAKVIICEKLKLEVNELFPSQ